MIFLEQTCSNISNNWRKTAHTDFQRFSHTKTWTWLFLWLFGTKTKQRHRKREKTQDTALLAKAFISSVMFITNVSDFCKKNPKLQRRVWGFFRPPCKLQTNTNLVAGPKNKQDVMVCKNKIIGVGKTHCGGNKNECWNISKPQNEC